MNTRMVKLLILKDWYLQRWTLVGYLSASAAALGLLGFGGETAFAAGSILLITVLIALGMHLAMATVIIERTEKTLPFVMSLPISPYEYTVSKIVANLLIFLLPWTALLIGATVVILGRPGVPDGLLPFMVLINLELFVAYCIVLCMALVSESTGWTIAATVACNLGLQAFLYYVGHLPSIAATKLGPSVVWNSAAIGILTVEIAIIIFLLAITLWLQSRKRDFL